MKPENFDEKVIEIAHKNYFPDYEEMGESHFKFSSHVQWCSVEIKWNEEKNKIQATLTDTKIGKTFSPVDIEDLEMLDWALFDWGNFYKKW